MKTRRRGTSDGDDARRPETVPSKDVELCLEVEIDDEVKELMESPEKCRSALLDVTVIKPVGLDRTTERQTLKSDDVKKLIDSLNLAGDDKRDLLREIFGGSPKTKWSGARMDGGDTTAAAAAATTSRRLPKRREQVYTTARTVDAMRSIFACKNKSVHDYETRKKDEPCLCKNCAVVGVLQDSQKRPFVTEPMPEPKSRASSRRPQRKKSVTFERADGPHLECRFLFERLSTRIGDLERKVRAQEERTVPKDYFRKIITKLVNHLTKLTSFATEGQARRKEEDRTRYHVHPLLVEQQVRVPAEKEYEPRPCCSSTEDPSSPGVWRWGGEILRPGIDLKNKIADLLEETFRGVRRGWEKSPQDVPDVSLKTCRRPVDAPRRRKASLDVAYVNPASDAWQESKISFRAVSSGACQKQPSRGQREELLRVIENATTADKFRLWQNIWNRALANGQSRDDAVTVEVKGAGSPAEARFTVGEMERLLVAHGRRR
ncbi:uncharacterized protein LOC132701876 [Cylas formicarius]|uniref:uncharacterized protein LOC132701876 n=1 Tax=Cylas formicarius TaxID=197179 RepID=UPI002958CFE2|nr:uncharacterized protein LOC132701876 [Cylas formicarius]